MALHGRFVINDAHYPPLSFPGVDTFLAFSGDGAYRNSGACGMIPKMGPVPAGKYWIVDRPEGGLKSQMNAGVRDIYNHFASGATLQSRCYWSDAEKRGNSLVSHKPCRTGRMLFHYDH